MWIGNLSCLCFVVVLFLRTFQQVCIELLLFTAFYESAKRYFQNEHKREIAFSLWNNRATRGCHSDDALNSSSYTSSRVQSVWDQGAWRDRSLHSCAKVWWLLLESLLLISIREWIFRVTITWLVSCSWIRFVCKLLFSGMRNSLLNFSKKSPIIPVGHTLEAFALKKKQQQQLLIRLD